MGKWTDELSDEEIEWAIAKDLIIHLGGIPTFYYPELLEDQYIYLFRTTELRWRLESDMRSLPAHSQLLPDLEDLRNYCDTFQAEIAKHSHPKGHNYWSGTIIPESRLKSIVEEYRRAMSLPIRRIIKEMDIYVISDHFKATMLEGGET